MEGWERWGWVTVRKRRERGRDGGERGRVRNRKRGIETSQVQSDSQAPEFLYCQQRRDDVWSVLVVNQYLHTGDRLDHSHNWKDVIYTLPHSSPTTFLVLPSLSYLPNRFCGNRRLWGRDVEVEHTLESSCGVRRWVTMVTHKQEAYLVLKHIVCL